MSGCATPPEVLFENPAFTVTVPEGWKSGKVRNMRGAENSPDFQSLEILKKGGAAVAEVNISWYDEILDLQPTIAGRMKRIEDARFFKV